jgi:hypothetical protein
MPRRRRNPISPPSKKRKHGSSFFSLQNAKARKGFKKNVIVAMLYMQPANRVPGLPNVCAFAGACREPCLNFSGQGGMGSDETGYSVQEARANLNRWYYTDKPGMVTAIKKSISALERASVKWPQSPTKGIRDARVKLGLKPTFRGKYKMAIRLNGTSDLPWERTGIMQSFPKTQFYDYTKNPNRMLDFLNGKMPRNYHLTFSMGGTADHMIPEILAAGGNVTIVFDTGRNADLPTSYGGRFVVKDSRGNLREVFVPETEVLDGDEDDLRFLDPKSDRGYFIGLRFKRPTHTEQARLLSEIGFDDFVYDPEAWPAQRINPAGRVRITVKKEDGEWVAVYYLDGKRHEDRTYYAADREDAEATAAHMRHEADSQARMNPRRRNPSGTPQDGTAFRFGCGGYNVVVR